FGKASGFSAALALASLPDRIGSDGFRFDGQSPQDRVGYSVSSAGDISSEGYADFIIGAPSGRPDGDPTGIPGTGAAYVLFGGHFVPEDVYQGDASHELIRIVSLDFQYIDGAAGHDTLA